MNLLTITSQVKVLQGRPFRYDTRINETKSNYRPQTSYESR